MKKLINRLMAEFRALRRAVASKLIAVAHKVEPRRQLSEATRAELRELAARADELSGRWHAIDRSLPPLPVDVGNGDITSILSLLEIRASSANRTVAAQAESDLNMVRAHVSAQQRIAAAEHPIQLEFSSIKSRRFKLEYGRS